MTILNIIIEPPSSNWWKQMQRYTVEHWTEPPKSSRRGGGVRKWAKRSRPWWGYSLKQFTWANGSPATLAWQQGNQHRTKLRPLNVGDSCMAGTDCGDTDSDTRIYPYCLYLCTPLIQVIGKQRYAELWVWGHPSLHNELEGNQGYTEKTCIKKEREKKNRETERQR